jgi:hypothetical protein
MGWIFALAVLLVIVALWIILSLTKGASAPPPTTPPTSGTRPRDPNGPLNPLP